VGCTWAMPAPAPPRRQLLRVGAVVYWPQHTETDIWQQDTN
jgi:hypothetical protein